MNDHIDRQHMEKSKGVWGRGRKKKKEKLGNESCPSLLQL